MGEEGRSICQFDNTDETDQNQPKLLKKNRTRFRDNIQNVTNYQL